MQAIASDRKECLLVNTRLRWKRPSRNQMLTDQGFLSTCYLHPSFKNFFRAFYLDKEKKKRNTMFNVKQCLVSEETCLVILALEMTHSYWF